MKRIRVLGGISYVQTELARDESFRKAIGSSPRGGYSERGSVPASKRQLEQGVKSFTSFVRRVSDGIERRGTRPSTRVPLAKCRFIFKTSKFLLSG